METVPVVPMANSVLVRTTIIALVTTNRSEQDMLYETVSPRLVGVCVYVCVCVCVFVSVRLSVSIEREYPVLSSMPSEDGSFPKFIHISNPVTLVVF